MSPKPKLNKETNASLLRQAMLRRLPRRVATQSEVTIPPVPGLLEHYVQSFNSIWTALGRTFTAADLEKFRDVLKRKLEEAWKASPYAKVIVTYSTQPAPSTAITWKVALNVSTIADEYAYWVETRTPPLFGKHPDMKALDLARSLGAPAEVPILDIGAGTGRNTLPLAREGFPADAVELAPALAKILRESAEQEKLPVRVFEGDVFDPALEVPTGHYRMLLLAEVVASHFRGPEMLRALFEASAEMLVPGGLLLFSAFLASDGYKPEDAARELSQVLWCNLFTRKELATAVEGTRFERLSDESVYDYEKSRLPESEWPPTGWYAEWTNGLDLFDLPQGRAPMELRWLVYRKQA